jgi:hypothetical protein
MRQRDMIRELIVRGGIMKMHPSEVREMLSGLPFLGFPLWEAAIYDEHLRSVIRLQEIDIENKIADLLE